MKKDKEQALCCVTSIEQSIDAMPVPVNVRCYFAMDPAEVLLTAFISRWPGGGALY